MLLEQIVFDQKELSPVQFQKIINKIAASAGIEDYLDSEISDDTIIIRFGERRLPTETNVVNIGGRFFNKEAQYAKLINKVPTIKTYNEYLDELGDRFIAKKRTGQKQEGQLDSTLPDDAADYIFQPKVEIVKEFRVVVFYMNDRYYVSGIYEKSGSNASFRSIKPSKLPEIANMAVDATDALGYGFSGVDIAIIHSEDSMYINESVLGRIASIALTDVGNPNDVLKALSKHYPVVLEVNSFPSLQNPAIAQDLLEALQKAGR